MFAKIAAAAALITLATASQANAGPAGLSMKAICLPWGAGTDGKVIAAAAERAGFKPMWVGQRLGMITLRPLNALIAEPTVRLLEIPRGCEITMSYLDARVLGMVVADFEAFATGQPPEERFVKVSDVVTGKDRKVRYAGPLGEVVIDDQLESLLQEVQPGAR